MKSPTEILSLARKCPGLAPHLIRKVVRVEEDLHVASLADECLRLLRLSAEHAGLPAVRDIRLGVAVNNLQQKNRRLRLWGHHVCVIALAEA